MSNTTTFRLGIIAGCSTHQADISRRDLFHRQLARKLLAAHNIKLEMTIARNFEDEYADRILNLLARGALDGIYLHMRVVFARKAGLLVSTENDGFYSYHLHPYLFNRKGTQWTALEKNHFRGGLHIWKKQVPPSEINELGEPIRTRIGGFRLREANLWLGKFLGLAGWAIRDELRQLDRARDLCRGKNLPLFVVGPTPDLDSPQRHHLTRLLSERIDRHLAGSGIPYCDFARIKDENGDALFQSDGFHLLPAGHNYLAEIVFAKMPEWVAGSLEK
jgi:hypothetical protein